MPYDLANRLAQASAQGQEFGLYRSEPLEGGLVTRFSPRFLLTTQAAELLNVDLDDPTKPKLRDGFLAMGGTASTAQAGLNATLASTRWSGMAYLHTTTGTKMLVGALDSTTDGRIYRRTDVTSGGTWVECLIGGATSFAVQTADAPIVQANDGMYIIPASGVNVHTVDSAGAVYDGGNANASPPRGAVDGCYFLNRMWLFKAGSSGSPPEAHYSVLLPDNSTPAGMWNRDGSTATTTSAGRLQLSPNWGGEARAIRPWNNTSLMAFFDNSVEEIIVNSADPQTGSTRNVIEPRFGCSSRDSVVSVGQEMFFADQFGHIRSLQQTVNGAQAGVVPRPISDPISTEIPGNVNKQQLSKIRCTAFKDKLYVWYPRLGSTEANAYATYSLSRRVWESVATPARPAGRVFISNIRGVVGDEMWFADGGAGSPYTATAKVYQMFPGTYTDDGTIIRYKETTKAFDYDAPEDDKLPEWVELEVQGEAGASITVGVKSGEDGSTEKLSDVLTVAGNPESSFPLTASSFPLLAAAFPITEKLPGIARRVFRLGGLAADGRARMHQLTFESRSVGKQIERIGYRLSVAIEPFKAEN